MKIKVIKRNKNVGVSLKLPKIIIQRAVDSYCASTCALMDQYSHLISVDFKIKVSNECPIIGEQVAIIFLT